MRFAPRSLLLFVALSATAAAVAAPQALSLKLNAKFRGADIATVVQAIPGHRTTTKLQFGDITLALVVTPMVRPDRSIKAYYAVELFSRYVTEVREFNGHVDRAYATDQAAVQGVTMMKLGRTSPLLWASREASGGNANYISLTISDSIPQRQGRAEAKGVR